MSTNGSRPRRPARVSRLSRRWRLTIASIVAVVIAVVLVTPVVLLTGGSGAKSCTRSLRYRGHQYVARRVAPRDVVEAIAIGVGVASGCGISSANVDLRSLAGVRPALAVALAADQSTIYVRRGVCPGTPARALLRCVRRA